MGAILITTSSFGLFDASVLTDLEQAGHTPVLNPHGRKLTEDEVRGLIKLHSPVGILAGVEPLRRDTLELAPDLLAIARCGIGMDSVDLEAARDLGIAVSNTPDGPTRAVAELVLGSVLTLLRGIHKSDAGLRASKWTRPFGTLLFGKNVGLVGCGRVGSMTARLFEAFGCTVYGTDPAKNLGDAGEMLSLDELLARCDIVSLHLPYSPALHHYFDENRIRSLKPGALLVNTSRGGLVDEEALRAALLEGRLSGAVLDTFEKEPYDGPLTDLENVLLTAHIGSYAREARVMMEQQAVKNLLAALKAPNAQRAAGKVIA